jgi:hypothetical protein
MYEWCFNWKAGINESRCWWAAIRPWCPFLLGLEYAVPRMGYVPLAPMIVMRRKVNQAARTWESRRRLLLDHEIAAVVDRWRRSFPYDRFFCRIYEFTIQLWKEKIGNSPTWLTHHLFGVGHPHNLVWSSCNPGQSHYSNLNVAI